MARILCLLPALFVCGVALAGDPDLVPDAKPKETKAKEGWDFLLTPGATASLSDNRSMLGQPEGTSATLGVTLASGADYRMGDHELRNRLDILVTYSRTPALDEFLKSADSLKIESIYLYHFNDWFGPYAKINLETSILESYAADPTRPLWFNAAASGRDNRAAILYRLTDGFSPLTLKETIGFFAQPYTHPDKKLSTEVRLGAGGMHVIADGQKAIQDDAATPEKEWIFLADVHQAGAELGLSAWGELQGKRIVYKAQATFFLPILNNKAEGDDRGAFDLMNVDVGANVSFKLLEWLSLDYQFKLLRQPQLLDKWQVQNNVLLTASYAVFKLEKEKKE
jgi:hypothetical protein